MNFEWTEEQRMLRRTARDFLDKEVTPVVNELDRKGPLPVEFIKTLFTKMRPLGFITGLIPKEYGGDGLDCVSYGILCEELFKVWASLGGIVMIQGSIARDFCFSASETLRQRLLPSLLEGQTMICGAITEPNVGSNPTYIETTATADGDDWVINGTKCWISNGSVSDAAIVVASIDRKKGAKGLNRFLVEKQTYPYKTRELHKMGLRAFPTSELIFEDCRISRECRLGMANAGLKETLRGFEMARCYMAIGSVGMAQAALDCSIEYAKTRKQFGKAIGSFQLIQEMIAEMAAETDAMRFLAYRALSLLDKGVRCSMESSMAKFYCTEAAVNVTSKGIQIHGAYGLSDEYPLERFFRDARSFTIPDGTTQIQKMIVARDILGLRAFD